MLIMHLKTQMSNGKIELERFEITISVSIKLKHRESNIQVASLFNLGFKLSNQEQQHFFRDPSPKGHSALGCWTITDL